jgi:hypothetical protein
MGFWSLIIHLANFVLPALVVGLMLAVLAPVFMGKRLVARVVASQAAINSVAGVVMLLVGLMVFGNDGKMATYGALVLATGTAQWWSLRR